MTKIKMVPALSAAADMAIDSQREKLFSNRAARIMVIGELKHAGRNQAGVDESKEDEVKLRFTFLEAAQGPKQDEHLRKAMETLKLQRTASGTIDQELQKVRLSKSMLEDCAGNLAVAEMARQRAVLAHANEHLHRMVTNSGWTEKQLRDQIRQLGQIVRKALLFDETIKLDEPTTPPAAETDKAEPAAAPKATPAKGKAELKTAPAATFTPAADPAAAPGPEGKTVELKPQPRKRAAKAATK